MPDRLLIGYLLIALIAAAAVYGVILTMRYRRRQRRIMRGWRPPQI